MTSAEKIRNFCIIAHIDHGKSTLADRLLEVTHTIPQRLMREQFLDKMDLERERGITIKAKAVRMNYRSRDDSDYILNLIDTPGHVDFNYEVSKSLAACEGTLLVVDASQGVEAQTVANAHLAKENRLRIIPVINKIDLSVADPEKTKEEISVILDIPGDNALLVSAKEGTGITDILEAVVHLVPPPSGNPDSPLQTLVFDSNFDTFRGVIVFIRVRQGRICKGMTIRMLATGKEFKVEETGIFNPEMQPVDSLSAGEVGYFTAGIKNTSDVKVGDTVVNVLAPGVQRLPGYKEVKPMVFSGLYPINQENYELLRECLGKLKLNDSSLTFEAENSIALGNGFRCGFLGLLHMEITRQRLEREYGLSLISTAANVVYEVTLTDRRKIRVDNPALLPTSRTSVICEPFIKASIITPPEYIGTIMQLCQDRRGIYLNTEYLSHSRALLTYEIPLAEIIIDFYDQLKSKTKGYASFDYELIDYRPADVVRVDIMIARETVDALSFIIHREKAYIRSKEITERLKEVIPRQMFELAIQACIGSKVIARETIPAKRKDVLAKCYGGDITRKRKLLEKQKEGKKKMKYIGHIELPPEAFMAVLSREAK